MSNVKELHLFEKAGLSLGVSPSASPDEVLAVCQAADTLSDVQKMARDILLASPPLTRRLIVESWHKRHELTNAAKALKLIASVPSEFSLLAPEREKEWISDCIQRTRKALAEAKESTSVFYYFYHQIKALSIIKDNTQPRCVFIRQDSEFFLPIMAALNFIEADRLEPDDKIFCFEVEPFVSKTFVNFEVRTSMAGKRGGIKSVRHGTGHSWQRAKAPLSFENIRLEDFVLSTLLRGYKNDTLIMSGSRSRIREQTLANMLFLNLKELLAENYSHPLTINEIERILHHLADRETVKRMRSAERMREWRAKHPAKPTDEDRQKAKEYMKGYRARNKAVLQEKQREYTKKWREKSSTR